MLTWHTIVHANSSSATAHMNGSIYLKKMCSQHLLDPDLLVIQQLRRNVGCCERVGAWVQQTLDEWLGRAGPVKLKHLKCRCLQCITSKSWHWSCTLLPWSSCDTNNQHQVAAGLHARLRMKHEVMPDRHATGLICKPALVFTQLMLAAILVLQADAINGIGTSMIQSGVSPMRSNFSSSFSASSRSGTTCSISHQAPP